MVLFTNSSAEIALFSLFLLQLVLIVFLIWINLNNKFDRLNGASVEAQEIDSSVEVFTGNCKKYFLTSREIEILKLISDGLPYKIIASQLNISENTVGTHVKNIFSKVNVTNKMELVSRIAGK